MAPTVHEFWPHDLVAGGAVNCRPGDEDVSDLIASIGAHGLLQPLVGRLIADETVEIIDGNRRLKALQQLFHDGTLTERVPVLLRDGEPEADAFEISLAANVLRKPLHPVAEYEAFAKLGDQGKSDQEIADHFGISLRGVEQRLALGRLHEDVRKAWHNGQISGEAAIAFTIARPEVQAAYLAEHLAGEKWRLAAHQIKRAFTGESIAANAAEVRFIGVEAYLAAGGEMLRDLFAEHDTLADRGLVMRLAGEKLAREAQRIAEEEGWAEVITEGDPEAGKRYNWDRHRKPVLRDDQKPAELVDLDRQGAELNAKLEANEAASGALDADAEGAQLEFDRLDEERATLEDEVDRLEATKAALDLDRAAWLLIPEDKRAKAVAIVGIGTDGALRIERGYLKGKAPPKPEVATGLARPAPKPAPAGEEEPREPARLPAALLDDLALTATRAAAFVLAEHPRIAMAALVATHAAWGTPIRLTSNGRGEGPELAWKGRDHNNTETSFGDIFRQALALPAEQLDLQVAHMIAGTLDFTSRAINYNNYDSLKPEAAQDLRCALPAEQHRAALVQAFDAEAYFTAAPKTEAIAAIAECGDDPGKHSKLKKGDLAAFAGRLAKARAWLPPVLRGEIFEAIVPPAEPEGPANEADKEPPAEPEDNRSAAQATLEIWLGEERARLIEMKAPELRDLLKQRGVTIPFGSSKMQLIELVLKDAEPPVSEAA